MTNISKELNSITDEFNKLKSENHKLKSKNDELRGEIIHHELASNLQNKDLESTSDDRDNYKRLLHMKMDDLSDLSEDNKNLVKENNELRESVAKALGSDKANKAIQMALLAEDFAKEIHSFNF